MVAAIACAQARVAAQQPVPPPGAAEQVPFEKTVNAYRAGPIGESVQIRVRDDQGRERRADVLVKLDASGEDGQGPLRGRIELGDLAVSFEGSRLLATHRLEKNRFAEFTLAQGPLLEAMEIIMPALVLPQLVLADRASNRIEDLGVLVVKQPVRWEPGVVDRPTGRFLYRGTAGDTTLRMLVDRTTGRLVSLRVDSDSGPIRSIDLATRSINPGPIDTWAVEIAGRRRVDALADLIAESDQVRVGERFPSGMSLLTGGLRPWRELRNDLASVFIFVRLDAQSVDSDDGEVRDAAIARLRRETGPANLLVRKLEAGSDGKWIARCVAIVSPSALRLDVVSILLSVLNPTDSAVLSRPDNAPVVAVAQSFDYDPILGGGAGGVVVLDKSRTVRAIITLGDVDATAKKVREVLETLK